MRHCTWALLVWIAAALPCASQDKPQTADPLKYKVLNLVYTVQEMGGKVLDLEVKETTTEIRIEMAADVLFEFDKADLLPRAETVLGQVADQTLHGLVLHQAHADVPGVFQTGSEEVHPAYRSIEEFDVHLPEIVLAELPG